MLHSIVPMAGDSGIANSMLEWVSSNGLIIVAIIGIIAIIYNWIKYIKGGNRSIVQLLVTAIILVIVLSLVLAAKGYQNYTQTLESTSTNTLNSIAGEVGKATGGDGGGAGSNAPR